MEKNTFHFFLQAFISFQNYKALRNYNLKLTNFQKVVHYSVKDIVQHYLLKLLESYQNIYILNIVRLH